MKSLQKSLVQLAIAIHAHVAAGDRPRLAGLPTAAWDRCADLMRRIRRAENHGWRLAAHALGDHLRYALVSVEGELKMLTAQLESGSRLPVVTRPDDIYQDLVALEEQFVALEFHRRDRWLAITTEPITLEGHHLGPFEIRLDWGRLSDESCYRVIALEPQPAASRDAVTHPHVLDEVLCEGDGRQAIRAALIQGRLLDFFTLVAGVLRHYNRESPFVALEVWHGRNCAACGYLAHEDETYGCGRCGEDFCDECHANCTDCGEAFCTGCISLCASCEENYCRECLGKCGACRAATCPGCLNEHERCPKCDDEISETSEDSVESDPPLQPHGVGQTSVSA